ncbi:hypothetical protein [Nocardia transvalensis]|uniref:hypothetical protein n=1 Tax=Nocardia transvalensis TaxID=37333 RepID=UPI0018941403|nr:hypothetical protein [Nocardia transvalensis]
MKVDPVLLRTMVTQLDTEADELRRTKADPGVDEVAVSVSGSAVATACAGGTLRVATALAVLISRIDHIGSTARGSADSYEVTDQAFADALNAMGDM